MMEDERCIAIAILDQLDVGGPFKVLPIVDEQEDCQIFNSEDEAREALERHLLEAFIHIIPLSVIESH
jgi:hypothetical protein